MTHVHVSGSSIRNEKGIALVAALLFLMVLTLLGTTAIMISSTDIKIGGNFKNSKTAFYDAEAGVQYVIKTMENGLAAGTLTLPTSTPVTVSYTVPSGFSFDSSVSLSKVSGLSEYTFQMTGHGGNNSESTIEVRLSRGSAFEYGIFGDDAIDMKNSGAAYSYDSRVDTTPTPAESTHEADIGSNVLVRTYNGTTIDGDVALGENASGVDGTYVETGSPGATVTGTEGANVERVNPDPLGAVGGDLATTFTTVSVSNDNAWGGLGGTTISLGNGDSLTLQGKTGGANYYITSVVLDNHSTLNIDASAGPVNIYLTGGLEAKNGSNINVTGLPTDFTIYSNSTTSSLIFKHDSGFKGTVYAPYAPVEMKNGADVCGLIWADTVDIKNSGTFYFDTAIKDKFASDELDMVSWREVR
ncbi:MAG: PilX N-terminal domain-containing pilus assembly protein [Pseudomonadota bacterium]